MNYMTIDEFIQWVAGYYVPYKKLQEYEVRDYLSGRGEEFIDALKTEVRDNFSGQYKTPPDVAVLREHAPRAAEYVRQHQPRPLMIEEGRADCTQEFKKLKNRLNITEENSGRGG